MIQMIEEETKLKKYLQRNIEDAGVSINTDSKLLPSEYIGIKVDDYYRGQHRKVTPKAVDFIVSVDCSCGWYVLYILELKGISSPGSSKAIREKFDTVVNQFMQKDFSDIFLNDRFKYRKIFLYLVTTAYKRAVELGNYDKYMEIRARLKNRDSLLTDDALANKPYKFRGKYYYIQKEVPPNPLIRKIT